MQVMIDIPEDVLKRTVFYREFKDLNDCITTIKALEKAVPLPKGHGDLIDRQELLKSTLCKTFGLRSVDIENAPTVIEAESEGAE